LTASNLCPASYTLASISANASLRAQEGIQGQPAVAREEKGCWTRGRGAPEALLAVEDLDVELAAAGDTEAELCAGDRESVQAHREGDQRSRTDLVGGRVVRVLRGGCGSAAAQREGEGQWARGGLTLVVMVPSKSEKMMKGAEA